MPLLDVRVDFLSCHASCAFPVERKSVLSRSMITSATQDSGRKVRFGWPSSSHTNFRELFLRRWGRARAAASVRLLMSRSESRNLFPSGATGILEGPACFRVCRRESGLDVWSLLGHAPRVRRGFRVETPVDPRGWNSWDSFSVNVGYRERKFR